MVFYGKIETHETRLVLVGSNLRPAMMGVTGIAKRGWE